MPTSTPTIVLHQWEMSPFCNKTRRCLRHKGLAYTVKDYNGLEARKASALSEKGQLPVLEYDGELVQDSTRIAQYLDQLHPEKLLYPQDPQTLARVRLWEDWAGASLYFFEIHIRMLDPVNLEKALDLICAGRPGWERWVMKQVFKRRYPQKLGWQGLGKSSRAEVEAMLMQHFASLEQVLADRAFLTGDVSNIADISVAAQIDEIVRTDEVIARRLRDEYPRLNDWLVQC